MVLPSCSVTTAVAKLSSALQGTVVVAMCAWPQAMFAAQTLMATISLARGKEASAVETHARLQAASAAGPHMSTGVAGTQSATTPSVLSIKARSLLCKDMVLPTCSVTTAVAKLSSALQGTVVVATCAWPQATSAAQT